MEHQLGQLISLPKIVDPRGNLTVAEQMKEVPFEINVAFGCMACLRARVGEDMPIRH